MNSSYNVGAPQYRLIQEEIQRGQLLFQRNPDPESFPWETLFAHLGMEVFQKHPRYIQVSSTF